jgi:hypothetical protein
MPHSSDDPPSAPTASAESETPSATAGEAPDNANPPGPSSADGEPHQPRRRRRRRRRPSATAVSQETSTVHQTTPEEPPPAGDTVQDTQVDTQAITVGDAQVPKPRRHRRRRRGPPREMPQQSPVSDDFRVDESGPPGSTTVTSSEGSTQAPSTPGVAGEPPRPRRRRRRPARRPGLTDQADASAQNPSGPEAVAEGASPSEPRGVGRPWPGRSRNRRPRDPAAREGEPRGRGPRQPREPAVGPRDAARAPDRRDQGPDARGRRDRRSSGRPPGRGREAPPRKPEQKLYALESVVDRGFEDVADDADGGGDRRVHWTIIKRTVADQKSGKAMSASYVLQREGVEAEFPNLGAARAAVNKTIVHPEKLTLSKAEHVAAKGSR